MPAFLFFDKSLDWSRQKIPPEIFCCAQSQNMIFSLAVYAAPQDSQASYSAYRFAEAALAQGHKIHRIFFYHQGVHNAVELSVSPQDEINLTHLWRTLAGTHHFELCVCIAAAIKRGVLDSTEATRYEKNVVSLSDGFELVGLGQLIEACVLSDRLVTFGN